MIIDVIKSQTMSAASDRLNFDFLESRDFYIPEATSAVWRTRVAQFLLHTFVHKTNNAYFRKMALASFIMSC